MDPFMSVKASWQTCHNVHWKIKFCNQYFSVNALLHLEQASGFSPVWILSCLSMSNNKLVTLATGKSNFATNTFLWMLWCIWSRQVAPLLYGSFHVCPCMIAPLSNCPLKNLILQPILFCESFVACGAGKWLHFCMSYDFMCCHKLDAACITQTFPKQW